ncbi:MAG TPA: cytochrome c1 [Azospirillaceae bacterium]|nr:cytochrome c1 [Azospirillaceae bacterium]
MRRLRTLFLAGLVALSGAGSALAAGTEVVPPHESWQHGAVNRPFWQTGAAGFFGTFNRAEAQRGFQVYKEVCATCHSLNLVSYRNLEALGFSEAEVKAIAAQYEVTDGPNDEGEMFTRKAIPADRFKAPFPNEKAAAAANGGKAPPDLSLMAKARAHGEDYIFHLLTGYREPPQGFQVPDGTYYNEYFPGHLIAMPSILNDGGVTYADGTNATAVQQARDVSVFLTWAAEPNLEARKRIGVMVLLFLTVLAAVLYAAKRAVWADQH